MGAKVPVPWGRAVSRGEGASPRDQGIDPKGLGGKGDMKLSLSSISASSKWHRLCSAVFKDADNNDTDPCYLLS